MAKLKPKIDRNICVGCSLCVENCPMECLRIENPKYHGDIYTIAELYLKDSCIGCKICMDNCPIDAITMKEEVS